MAYNNQQKCCRICFERTQDRSPLIAPCQCKGSSLYIHIHCLEIWQQISLQNNLPHKAEVCPICRSTFTYPSRTIRFYRRTIYRISNFWNFIVTFTSLLWISLVIVPLKVLIYTILVLFTIPYGQLSLLGNTAVAWIGFEFPPQLALIYTYPVELLHRQIWPLSSPLTTTTTSTSRRDNSNSSRYSQFRRRSSSSSVSLLSPLSATQLSVLDIAAGVLLVASKEVPPSSMFYRAVILLLDYNPRIGSRGVIINFDTTANPSLSVTVPNLRTSTADFFSSLPPIPSMRYGLGGPMEVEVVTVLHNYPSCSRYSERCIVPMKPPMLDKVKDKEKETTIHTAAQGAPQPKENNSFYFAENQHALRTLLKISEYLFQPDPTHRKPTQPVEAVDANRYEEIKRKLKTALRNLTKKLNITLLRPFPFLESNLNQVEEENSPDDHQMNHNNTNNHEVIEEFPATASPLPIRKRNHKRTQPQQHRFFHNPNYRGLSTSDSHSGLSPQRIQQHLLSEVKERLLLPDHDDTSNHLEESPTATAAAARSHLKPFPVKVSWSHSTEYSVSNDPDEYFIGDHQHNTVVEEEPLLFAIKGNCIWLANQLEGEIMHGFWHVVPEYNVAEIFSKNPEVIRNLWNQLIQAAEDTTINQ